MKINWNISGRCNLSCRHCYYDFGIKELKTEECLEIMDSISDFFGIGTSVTLGGGEPLVREDIYEIISAGKKRGLRMILASNGTLITQEVAKKLKNSGIEEVIIPIDGLKDSHEFMRGKRTFDLAINGIECCKREGIDVVIDPCITRYNRGDLSAILDLSEKLGARQCRIFHFIPMGRGRRISEVELKVEEYCENLMRIYEEQCRRKIEICTTQGCQYWVILWRMERKGGFVPGFFYNEAPGCRAGIEMISIKPNGDVVPCPMLEIRLGNILEEGFEEILESEILSELRNRKVKGRCGECTHRMICGGCRARAYLEYGDYLEEDPLCGDFFFERI